MTVTALVLAALTFAATPSPTSGFSSIRDVPWRNWTYDLSRDEPSAELAETGGKLRVHDWRLEKKLGADSFVFEVVGVDYGELEPVGEVAVVTETLWTGGNGIFTSAEIFTLSAGRPIRVGRIPGGDRGDGGIYTVGFLDGRLKVHRLDSGGAGACCPNRLRLETWSLRDGRLVEDARARTFESLVEVPERAGCRTTVDCPAGDYCEQGSCREAECHSGDRTPNVLQRDCPNGQKCTFEDAISLDRDIGFCEPL